MRSARFEAKAGDGRTPFGSARRRHGGFAAAGVVAAMIGASAEPVLPAAPCGAVPGLSEVLAPGNVVLFGEVHGTVEAPEFVGEVVCAARLGRPDLRVTVALEIPVEEAASLDEYLDSSGGPEDRERLLAGAFWRREVQDGRSSAAMAELLERLRGLRRDGTSVEVVAFDHAARASSSQERDREMARRLEAVAASSPRGVLLVLTGNVHSRVTVGTPWDAGYEPMGYLLAGALPGRRVVGLRLASPGGEAWICTGDEASACGPVAMAGHGPGAPGITVEGSQPTPGGHHGVFRVRALTASPPARSSL